MRPRPACSSRVSFQGPPAPSPACFAVRARLRSFARSRQYLQLVARCPPSSTAAGLLPQARHKPTAMRLRRNSAALLHAASRHTRHLVLFHLEGRRAVQSAHRPSAFRRCRRVPLWARWLAWHLSARSTSNRLPDICHEPLGQDTRNQRLQRAGVVGHRDVRHVRCSQGRQRPQLLTAHPVESAAA